MENKPKNNSTHFWDGSQNRMFTKTLRKWFCVYLHAKVSECACACMGIHVYLYVSVAVHVSVYLCLSVCLSVFFSHENAPISVFFEFRRYSGLRSLSGEQALHGIRRDLKGKWSPILSAKSLVYDWSLFHGPVRITMAQLCSLMINESAVR